MKTSKKFRTAHAICMEKIFRIHIYAIIFSEYFENWTNLRRSKFQHYIQSSKLRILYEKLEMHSAVPATNCTSHFHSHSNQSIN